MNRTTATCIAGMRSKTTSRIKIHFQRPGPREAEPFTRRVFVVLASSPRDFRGDLSATPL